MRLEVSLYALCMVVWMQEEVAAQTEDAGQDLTRTERRAEELMSSEEDERSGRYLVYNPNGGVYKLILAWAVPVELPQPFSVVWGHNFQFQYKPVDNATQFAYPYFEPPPKLSRATLYTIMEETLNMYGLDGRGCVLRTLCEASHTRLSHDSIYGHIFNTILTPPATYNNSYYRAWSRGKSGSSCEHTYSSCEFSLLDLISTYV